MRHLGLCGWAGKSAYLVPGSGWRSLRSKSGDRFRRMRWRDLLRRRICIEAIPGTLPRRRVLLHRLVTGPVFRFVDIAAQAGLTAPNTFGGRYKKDLILESTGTGAAIFDYNRDGANDVFIANGAMLDPRAPATRSQLYRNDGKGHFTEVSGQAGLTRGGWAQAACVGDIDNDGHPDLLVTHYGHNSLYRNNGDGTFADITASAGLPTAGTRWGSGCAFIDYDRDGLLDIFIANYVDLDFAAPAKPGSITACEWKGMTVMCGPRGLPMGHNVLYHNNGDGTFTDVSEKAGILAAGGCYGLGAVGADFDSDGWPDIYVACDQSPSLLYRNNHDGTFEERADAAGVAYSADGQLQAGMGIAVADYEGRGFLDIAKTNFSADRPSLYRNGDGKFSKTFPSRRDWGEIGCWGGGLHFSISTKTAGPTW
jgi:enediyne biosynthesis protein E4